MSDLRSAVQRALGPAVVIQIDLEEKAPVVLIVAATDEQEARIKFWIRSQDELAALVERALELRNEGLDRARK